MTVPTVAAAERLGVPHLEGLFSVGDLRITLRATGSRLWQATEMVDAMRRRDLLGWGSRCSDGFDLPSDGTGQHSELNVATAYESANVNSPWAQKRWGGPGGPHPGQPTPRRVPSGRPS